MFLYKAEKIPKNNPSIIAMVIEDKASIAVFGNVFLIISITVTPFFWYDSLKYGVLKTILKGTLKEP